MLSPVDLVRTHLLADPAITAAVGGRVFHLAVPQGARVPNLLVIPVSADPDETLDLDGDPVEHRVVVAARADTVAGANEIGRLVIARLGGFSGEVDGRRVELITVTGDDGEWVDELKLAVRLIDLEVAL
ncbi:hypothetical protein CCR97_18985 [Rhodoplanes elegans]|uniref:DUF3168 domain-containing protein n=1 Tax=Rhodoplanes elegans TaxID=29408 RepID=A0A327KZ96_9BRAD|nr:DUF3168 domain-containing protein [Rhodoplanes elegans]MBK5960270.1 hypothetical protein [Rhodoplanes elegans]RAI40718.1 hypothetical protein CH338_05370 [Rhodoplanes elegans]